MRRLACCLMVGLLFAAGPARAGDDVRPRLVTGGFGSYPLLVGEGWSLGTWSSAPGRGGERMALGGYAALAVQETGGIASLRLGYDWNSGQTFSLNPLHGGLSVWDNDGAGRDMSVMFGYSHDLTPAFSLGGFAGAVRGDQENAQPATNLHFGAGLGLKF